MAKSMHVAGDELKKLLKLGKKRPMPFAFCPSSGDDDNVLIIHRKRKPDMLGKIARKEGEGTKIAFGTLEVKGKRIFLSCERQMGGLAKRMKRHMKLENMPMNIIVLDEDGNELESDIEDLGDDDDLGDDIDDADDADDAADDDDEAIDDAAVPGLDPASLVARINAIKPDVDARTDDVGAQLKKILEASVAAIKGDKLDAADNAIAKVEATLERLAGTPAAPPPPPPPGGASSEAVSMVQRINKAKGAAEAVGGELATKILGLLGPAAAAVKAGDIPKAATVMDAVEQALAKAKSAAEAAAQSAAQPAQAEAPAQDMSSPDAQKWLAAQKQLMPVIEQTLSEGKGDLSALTASWATATEKADQGDFPGALAIVPRISDLIKEARAATQSQAEAAIPDDVVPFVKSRLAWIDSKKKMRAELSKLKSEMDKVLGGIEGMKDVASQTGKLFDNIEGLDTRLEDTLEALVEAPDGTKREDLKKDARTIISQYQSELDSDFFKDVDGNNGFTPVAVTSTAINALKGVSSALA